MRDDIVRNPEIVNGRFKRGNRAAVGRQSRGQKLRGAILQAISKEDIEIVTHQMVDAAKSGDIDAMKLLLNFIGKGEKPPTVAIQTNISTAGQMFTPGRAAAIVKRLREQRASEKPDQS